MKPDTLQAANAERRESVAVLKVGKRALIGRTATVEVTEPLRMARYAREQATAESELQGWLVRSPLRRGAV